MKILLSLFVVAFVASAYANTAIETETAQLGKQGEFAASQSYEYAHSRDGTSGGTLTQFEYAFSDRAEILIEPFFYVWDQPRGEARVSGRGDLEITPSYMAVVEDGWVPALVLATKVKVPTGTRKAGGSGKYDLLPYVILGQHYDAWTFNANLGVNFARREDTRGYDHRVVWDLQAERDFGDSWTTFLEVFSAEDGVKTASTALQYKWIEQFNTFAAIAYNEDHEAVVRLGFNVEF